ncbi:unnamed protein product, partial [Pylaiella littoralis]
TFFRTTSPSSPLRERCLSSVESEIRWSYTSETKRFSRLQHSMVLNTIFRTIVFAFCLRREKQTHPSGCYAFSKSLSEHRGLAIAQQLSKSLNHTTSLPSHTLSHKGAPVHFRSALK